MPLLCPCAMTGQPEAEAACADLAADWAVLADLDIALAIAAADLAVVFAEFTGFVRP